ncbi:hypothetical protein [Halorubellus litoreus]|uniref:DNA primase small subunit n=1 Tax=Halorubellus litoreus TaxID=755308 RepID=A0ABD5VDY5_9EURY
MTDRDLIRQASEVWAPDFPRQTVDASKRQFAVNTRDELVDALVAVNGKNAGFVSVYSFPRGHSRDRNIPEVNTLMFDLDVPDAKEYRPGDVAAWRRDQSNLLARVRMIARFLIDAGADQYWRGSLSGFKGVHLYLDFPAINPDEGSYNQFKAGLGRYADEFLAFLESETSVSIRDWVDVDSSDLGRLTRHPNTVHTGATAFFNDERYCVPVSLRELATITPDEYEKLTSEPRPLPDEYHRVESERAGQIITQYVRTASVGGSSGRPSMSSTRTLSLNEYENEVANHKIKTKEDVAFVTAHKPCVFAYFERDGDQFEYGHASHKFEVFVIDELVDAHVPVEVIVDLFREIPGFNEDETRSRIADVIAANWARRFNCETIWAEAPMFCLGEVCGLYDPQHPIA